MQSDTEIKQAVIAILTCARDGDAGSESGLVPISGTAAGNGRPRNAMTAAVYAMSLFYMLAAEFEAACPDVDVQAFLRRRALELAMEEDGEAA